MATPSILEGTPNLSAPQMSLREAAKEAWYARRQQVSEGDAIQRAAHQSEGARMLRSLVMRIFGRDIEAVEPRVKIEGITFTVRDPHGSWEPSLRAVCLCGRCGSAITSDPIEDLSHLWRLESQNFFGHPHVCPTATPLLG